MLQQDNIKKMLTY